MYSIFATDEFLKIKDKLDHSEQEWIRKMEEQLMLNPQGKILRFSWFREKKYLNKRLYYLVDDEQKRILFVTFASKKKQEQCIAYIQGHMEELLLYLKGL